MTNGRISYVMQVLDGKYLLHRYFGSALPGMGLECPSPLSAAAPPNTETVVSISTLCRGNILPGAEVTAGSPLCL